MKNLALFLAVMLMVSGSAFAMGSTPRKQSAEYQKCLAQAFEVCYAEASARFPTPFFSTPEGNAFFTACKTPKEKVCVDKFLN